MIQVAPRRWFPHFISYIWMPGVSAADTGTQAPSRYVCACVVYCPRLDYVFIYGSRDHLLPSSHGCGFCWACVVTGAEVAASPGGGDLFGVTFCCAACIALAAGTCGNAWTGFVHVRIAVHLLPVLCALHHRPPAPVQLLLGGASQTS